MSGEDYPSDDDKSFVSARSSHHVSGQDAGHPPSASRFSSEEEAVRRRHRRLLYRALMIRSRY